MKRTLIAGVVALLLSTTAGATQKDHADRILERARAAVSETRNAASVEALAVETRRVWDNGRDARDAFTLLLPDKFQVRTGRITHTLAGGRFWQDKDNPPEVQEQAKRNTTDRAARMTILFLLRTPGFGGVRAVARPTREFEGRRADAVEFAGQSFALTLFVDAESHLPLGFESGSPQDAAGSHRGVLRDYKAAGGVRFPFRIDETIGEFRSVVTVERLEVNPPGAAAQFGKR